MPTSPHDGPVPCATYLNSADQLPISTCLGITRRALNLRVAVVQLPATMRIPLPGLIVVRCMQHMC